MTHAEYLKNVDLYKTVVKTLGQTIIKNPGNAHAIAKQVYNLGKTIWGKKYNAPHGVKMVLSGLVTRKSDEETKRYALSYMRAHTNLIRSQMPSRYNECIPDGCFAAKNLVIGLNDVDKAEETKLAMFQVQSIGSKLKIGPCRNAVVPKFNGEWTQTMEDMFNNGHYAALERQFGFTHGQSWTLAVKRHVNTREGFPVKIKTIQKTHYQCHADWFQWLINGDHDEIMLHACTDFKHMEAWVKKNLAGYFEWNGANKPLKKICNANQIQFQMTRKNVTRVYTHAI